MKLHEYQSKEIFRKYGISTPEGAIAESESEVREVYERLAFNSGCMVKAQVLVGGRGKAGGIKKANSPDEAAGYASDLIGSRLKTYQAGSGQGPLIKSVLLEGINPFQMELYMGVVVDRSQDLPVLIFSESGGMDIEQVAKESPEKVQHIPFVPSEPFDSSHFEQKLALDKAADYRTQLSEVAYRLAKIFIEEDCSLIEINPLVITNNKKVVALDAKIVFDDNAVYRHEGHVHLKDPDEDDPSETRAKKFGLNYISLEGNVGCLVNGAGLAMTTMDAIKAAGGSPANFLDVGGGATKEAVQEGFSIMIEDPNVKAILVNIFGGIMKCDIIAQALVDAARDLKLSIPVIVRLEGTNVEEGRKILKESGLALGIGQTIMESANLAVEATKG